MSQDTSPTSLHGAAPLPSLGVIAAEGDEAASFLHSQLTQDFALLGVSEARLAALCTAKGRMLASFVAFKRAHDRILLVCRRDLLPATLKRLQMFVLRAKVKLRDASDEFALRGLAGDAVPAGLGTTPWSHLAEGDVSVVRLYPAGATPRALWVGPPDAAPAAPALTEAQWDWLEVISGVATLSQPVVEAFVPQMLNYESVGGVNFKKGCYPGQEVVARSQFRGTLKRRAYLAHADAPLQAGQEVFHASDAEQPTGTVVQAAPNPQAGWDAIVSMQTGSADGAPLRAGEATLHLLPLPYPLLDDI
ncbi:MULTISPECIES: CAF17-like 4Fe-4S cluster assembly/insertion protein YgfZ [Hydrogenophaga]|uniref:Folate-binding protein YgfZ n=1 Tax=Hydrogenophaga intermedia TaxID=65786 RepID=A0A1L1PI83_HYDIT|nr:MULTISPECIES: folate-binding protein YgfZ [Hydrogenophaga]AOS79192.1 folate-binding protein [Hydrogenophaga sp. PBC]TMU72449.1 folate-binding protein YgfZ [Hydrogenophaga intermedia]CDN87469.1 Folate-binding protein YgfZ [Hydrogenophaga intermedia]